MKFHIELKKLISDRQPSVPRSVVWLGDSRKNVRAFPAAAKRRVGYKLRLIQFGDIPKDAKPFKGVGSGILEIAVRHDANAYRLVLAVQLGREIYVLHAFQKKAKSGVKTPKTDIAVIKRRYKRAKEPRLCI